MKRTLSKFSQFLFVAGLLLALAPNALKAQTANAYPPPFMTYQGFLTDGNGTALATNAPKNYDVIFRIYTASTGGSEAWAEQQTVTVDKGYFSVLLGEGSQYNTEPHGGLPTLFATNNASDRYIEMTVKGIGSGGSDATILPRLRLMSSPYAFLAQTANTVDGAALTTGTVSDSRLSSNVALRSGGNAFSGNQIFNNNLGVGTSTPGYPLNFGSSLGDKISLYGNSGTHYGLGVQGGLLQIYTDSYASDVVFGYGNSASMAETMRIKGNGNVGIGTPTPAVPLHVMSGSWPTAIIDGTSTAGTWLDIHNNAGGTNWNIISTGTGNGEGAGKLLFRPSIAQGTINGAQPLTLTPSGNVGIGTYNPTRAALEVDGWSYNAVSDYGYLASSGTGHITGSGGSQPYSIYAQYRVAGQEFNAFSDARIKNIKGQSDSQKDLATLMKIKVTDYTMKDTIANGNRPVKKVIGQEVEKVYPLAVTRTTDVVPDIYTKSEAKAGWVTLDKQLKPALKVGDKVRLITDKGATLYDVTEVKPNGFRVKEALNGSVFVYGREVSDFRTVDYNAIAMLNVSATQELYRELHEKTAELSAVKAKLSAVESMAKELASLKKQMAQQAADRDARLDALEAQLHNQQAQNGVRTAKFVSNDQ